MLLNEHDAREKWCHVTLGSSIAKCMSSDCMAWRWAEYTPNVCEKCGSEDAELKEVPEMRRGFCGLAQMPKF